MYATFTKFCGLELTSIIAIGAIKKCGFNGIYLFLMSKIQ